MSFKPSDHLVTDVFAKFASNLSLQELPSDVVKQARMFLLDTMGIIIGGAAFERANDDEMLKNYLTAAGETGVGSAMGVGGRLTPLMAAFANGFRSEILDFQDTYLNGKIHCSSTVVPAVIAAGEQVGASGADVLCGIIAGYEVGCRIAQGVMPDHARAGFQVTGTYATCAAAVAAGRAMDFDKADIAQALSICGFVIPTSNADNVLNGHTIKPVHAAQAAMSGLSAALMSQSGFKAGSLEGEAPRYFSPLHILGCSAPNFGAMVEGLGDRWLSRDVSFKKYPVMLVNAGPVESALALRKAHDFSVDEIEEINIFTFQDACGLAGQNYTQPGCTYVKAQFSMPFCVAAALTDGEVTPQQFLDSRLAEPSTHELAAKIQVHHDPLFTEQFPSKWPVRIDISLKNGVTLSKTIETVDWSNHQPPTWGDIVEKFSTLAAPVLGGAGTRSIVELVEGLEGLKDISDLMKYTRPERSFN